MDSLRQGMVSIFLAMAIKNKHIIVKGNTNRYRDFIYIDDVVDAFVACEKRSNTFNDIYNVATGVKTNVDSLLSKILNLLDYDIKIEVKGNTPGD
jgi:UDP-glucose 4-epimerase